MKRLYESNIDETSFSINATLTACSACHTIKNEEKILNLFERERKIRI